MSASPLHEEVLGDDAFAPLKRNHACLQCKKRKVKCDGTKPACSPCLRSHAHALRTAQRNKSSPPVLCCSWADVDTPSPSDDEDSPVVQAMGERRSSAEEAKRKTSGKVKKGSGGPRNLEREKEIRRDEEKETLFTRIAELEARLASLSPSDSQSSTRLPHSTSNLSKPATSEQFNLDPQSSFQSRVQNDSMGIRASVGVTETQAWSSGNGNATTGSTPMDWDLGGLFMVPANWPHGLPAPFLLDHLVETFFTHVPQLPRMLNRSSLLTRLRLPPTHHNFPHPSLLHVICAVASTHTAWVNNLPPDALDEAIQRHKSLHFSLDAIEDFGLAQAEAAQRSIRMSTSNCSMTGGIIMFEMLQSHIILSELYSSKGLPLQACLLAGSLTRMIKTLELLNKNKYGSYKEPLCPKARDAVEREERLSAVWQAFIFDAGFTLNTLWNPSFDLEEIICPLPANAESFKTHVSEEYFHENPQSAHSRDLYTYHPVPDSFVMLIKASILGYRVAKYIRNWQQRDIVPGDDYDALRTPEFSDIVNSIHTFQASIPDGMRSMSKVLKSSSQQSPIDANTLLVHMIPHLALAVLHERFVDWQSPSSHALLQLQRGCEGVLGILHLIPSNLDVTLVSTSNLIISLYTTGRFVAHFVQRLLRMQQFGVAMRYRADLTTIQSVMIRYGQKCGLGQMMSMALDNYNALDLSKPATIPCIEPAPHQTRNVSPLASQAPLQSTNLMDRNSQTWYPPNPESGSSASGSSFRREDSGTSSSSGITPPQAVRMTPSNGETSRGGLATPDDAFGFPNVETPGMEWINNIMVMNGAEGARALDDRAGLGGGKMLPDDLNEMAAWSAMDGDAGFAMPMAPNDWNGCC